MRIGFFGDSLTAGIPGSSYLDLLRERLPGHTLVNLGQANDTVVSLYRRVQRLRLDEPFDLAFLWVGVNDVAWRRGWPVQVTSRLLGKRPSRDEDEFRRYYQSTLELVCRHARRVVTVSPLLRGEDVGNEWNRRLAALSRVVEEVTSGFEQASFLDLRALFVEKLEGKPISGYLSRNLLRVGLDVLRLHRDEQIDRVARQRGLHYTLDGLHLNSAGAELVAEAFLEVMDANQLPLRTTGT